MKIVFCICLIIISRICLSQDCGIYYSNFYTNNNKLNNGWGSGLKGNYVFKNDYIFYIDVNYFSTTSESIVNVPLHNGYICWPIVPNPQPDTSITSELEVTY